MKLNWPGDEQSRIWREETEVAKGNKTNRSMKRPGEWQHVTLQFVPPRMWIAVDGKEVMAFEEAHWLPDADTFSLLTTDQVCLDNIRIYTKRE